MQHNNGIVGFVCFECNRYVATDIPSDLLVKVGEVNFHLHKVTNSLEKCLNTELSVIVIYFIALLIRLD